MRRQKRIVRTLLVAAVLILLAATVYAVGAQITILITRERDKDNTTSVQFEEAGKNESLLQETLQEMADGIKADQMTSVYEAQYSFPKEEPGTYIELGYWLPASIPEGYEETFVSDRAYGAQVILYENSEGRQIRFEYAKPSGFGGVTMKGVVSEETVDIGGDEGVLFRKKAGGSLFWMKEQRGLGFYLSVDDPDVDLIAMARGIAESDPYGSPEVERMTQEALAGLGDYSVTWLPEGFEERDCTGVPVPDGGWYGYVRRFYTDKATNREVSFSYEPFVVPEDAVTQDPDAYFLSIHTEDAHVATVMEETTVNGMTGVLAVNPSFQTVYWIDAEQGLSFELSSAALTLEELQQMAESVKK